MNECTLTQETDEPDLWLDVPFAIAWMFCIIPTLTACGVVMGILNIGNMCAAWWGFPLCVALSVASAGVMAWFIRFGHDHWGWWCIDGTPIKDEPDRDEIRRRYWSGADASNGLHREYEACLTDERQRGSQSDQPRPSKASQLLSRPANPNLDVVYNKSGRAANRGVSHIEHKFTFTFKHTTKED